MSTRRQLVEHIRPFFRKAIDILYERFDPSRDDDDRRSSSSSSQFDA
jgi:cation transport regulator ChaB